MKINQLTWFGLTEEERDKIPAKYLAQPPNGFPCDTQAHLVAAAKLLGKEPADEQPAIKKRANSIAKELGLDIPESWKGDAKMRADSVSVGSFELGSFGSPVGDLVPWGPSKIFEAGCYPVQGMEPDEDYLEDMVTGFRGPIQLYDTHMTPGQRAQSIFAGKLGFCDRVVRKGVEIFGSGMIPRAIKALVGDDPIKASIEVWKPTRTITEIAMLNFPQVEDAEIAAAFGLFAGARSRPHRFPQPFPLTAELRRQRSRCKPRT